jgi:hypothetical protein
MIQENFYEILKLSHIPEEFYETASKCLFELLLQPENFERKTTENTTNTFKPYLMNSIENTLGTLLKTSAELKEPIKIKKTENIEFSKNNSKQEFFEFIQRQNQMWVKHEDKMKKLDNWEDDEEEEDSNGFGDAFDENQRVSLNPVERNIIEELRRTRERVDLFLVTPQEKEELEIASEIERLNFGGMPMNVKSFGEQVVVVIS